MLQTDRILLFLLFKMEHSAGFLCPAVLLHIFALEFRSSCFKIRKIVTPDPFRIYSVIRGFVLKHTASADLLQRIFQIKYQLADIRQVLGVIRTAGKEYRAYLPCGHSCPASVNKHRQNQLGLCSIFFVLLRRYFQRYFRSCRGHGLPCSRQAVAPHRWAKSNRLFFVA